MFTLGLPCVFNLSGAAILVCAAGHVGFHHDFQLSGYGGDHHGKGTEEVHVGFHARSVLYSWQLLSFEKNQLNVKFWTYYICMYIYIYLSIVY